MTTPPSDLVTVDHADVLVAGTSVAVLQRHDDHVEFRYTDPDPDGPTVATTLPRSRGVVITPARSVPPYFAGLLPEGRRLTALRTALKTSADDDFSMLLAVGAEPVGDVQVMPAGEGAPAVGSIDAGATSLAETSFTELFAAATGQRPDRGGLAGVQDKVSGRMISLPLRTAGTAAILKLDPPEFAHLVENEYFFLRMARDCGLATVDAGVVHDRDGRPGLLVDRFDRHTVDGTQTALAVEDGCQVLDRYPGDKYALTTEEVTSTLAGRCRAAAVARRAIFRQVVFAIATGNGDLHAKNLSIVRRDDEWFVAPAYDLPSSYPYGDTTLAMSLDGTREGQVSRARLLRFAAAIDLPARAAAMTLDETVRAAEPWLERLDELPFDADRIRNLRRFMTARLRLLRT